MPPVTSERILSQEELAALLAEAEDLGELSRGPLPAVLDTDFIRTGLEDQLKKGKLPASVWSAQDGSLRLFMEYDTLVETQEKLPKFADQLGVSVDELRRILNQDWLPNIDVVRLPPALREVDPRALLVRDLDREDFPAAALATLLSPCLLLTHNSKHFSVLGVKTRRQGVEGVMALIDINIGDMQVRAVIWLPTVPIRAAGATMKWATEKIGNWAWALLVVIVGGAIFWYFKQPTERRESIKRVASSVGNYLLDEYVEGAEIAYQGRLTLRACAVPRPERRTPVSAILRELALSEESLSAAQLAEHLDPSVRPSVNDLRAFLRAHDNQVFKQVRRGGFVLGSHYRLRDLRSLTLTPHRERGDRVLGPCLHCCAHLRRSTATPWRVIAIAEVLSRGRFFRHRFTEASSSRCLTRPERRLPWTAAPAP